MTMFITLVKTTEKKRFFFFKTIEQKMKILSYELNQKQNFPSPIQWFLDGYKVHTVQASGNELEMIRNKWFVPMTDLHVLKW